MDTSHGSVRCVMSLIACTMLVALLSSCKKNPHTDASAAGTGARAAPAGSAMAGATLGIAGHVFKGSDRGSIRTYLQTVHEIKAARFEVKWSPATVAVGREAAMRALESVSQDGSTFVFAANEPVVGTIKPGSILWIWDIALRRVDSVAADGDGTVVVHTSAIPFAQAFTRAHMQFSAPVTLRNSYLTYRPHLPPDTAAAKRTSLGPTALTPRVLFASLGSTAVVQGGERPAQPNGDAPSGGDDGDWGEGAPVNSGFAGSLKGYEYSLGYGLRPAGLTLTLEAKKEDGGSDAGVLNLFGIASDKLDVRFRSRMDLDDFTLDGGMDMSDGSTDKAQVMFNGVNGTLHVAFIGRLGEGGNGQTKVPVMHLPLAFYVPIPVDGIPFVVQLASDFNLNVFLAGNHATLKVEGGLAFNGNEGLSATKSASQADDNMTAGDPKVDSYEEVSPGVSAVVLGVQMPRIGFGVGILGFQSMAYSDIVSVLTMTNGAETAAPLGLPPCKRVTLEAWGHVGIETVLPSLPLISGAASDKLSPNKEIWHANPKVITKPDVPACQIK
jgi:hypothetical protein